MTILALFFLEEIALFAAILGFYLGFLMVKETQTQFEKVKGKRLWVKQGIGFALLGLILLPTLIPSFPGMGTIGPTKSFLLYFLGGLWISAGYPWLYEKVIKKYHR